MRRFLPALLLTVTLLAVRLPAQQDCEPCTFQLTRVGQIFAQPQPSSSGFLGVRLADIDEDRAQALKLGELHGVEVKAVMEGSPADSAGILPGDVLLTYNGETVLGAEQLSRMVRETPPGRKVKLEYWRSGKVRIAVVVLATNSNSNPLPALPMPNWETPPGFDFPTPMILWHNSTVGIDFECIDSQLAAFFGVKSGVLVRSVQRGSLADKAGVRAGDVIFSVAQQTLSTEHEFSSLMRQRGAVLVSLMRDHKRIDLTISLPPQ